MVKTLGRICAVLLIGGCASMANTPAQDATWARLRACGASQGNIQVATDGSWQIKGSDDGQSRKIAACMGGRVN